MTYQLGGDVRPSERREYGSATIRIESNDPLFADIGEPGDLLPCWMSHGDKVITPAPGFQIVATTDSAPVAAIVDPVRSLYGVQFHPEVAHTPFGAALLRNFLYGPCGHRRSDGKLVH